MRSPETSTQRLSYKELFERVGKTASIALFSLCLTGSTPERELVDVNKLAVLGDSITAGVGDEIGNYEDIDGCRRSKNSIGDRIASLAGIEDVKNSACIGASVDDLLLRRGQYGEPAQLDTLDPKTEVVVLSIGGNMANLEETFNYCMNKNCNQKDGFIRSVLDRIKSEEYKQSIKDLYEEILEIAPDAKLFVLGYVSPIEIRDICPYIIGKDQDEFIQKLIEELNKTIKQAIDEVHSHDIYYVKPAQGADLCMTLGVGFVTEIDNPGFGHPSSSTQGAIAYSAFEEIRQAKKDE